MKDDNAISSNELPKEGVPGEPLAQIEGPVPTPNWRQRKPSGPGRGLYITAIILGIIIVLLLSLYVFLAVTRKAPTHASASPTPASVVFHNATCPFKPGAGIVEGTGVKCGFLMVPEDRSHPQGPAIQLAVAVFKASSPTASSTPLLFLQGGPGGALLSDLGSVISTTNLPMFSQGHDLVLLDQRGTGYSTPSLACKEINALQVSTLAQNLSRDQSTTLFLQAMRACHDRLQKSSINLNAYTTIANATDVHDLVHALGYKQVDLYGASYGTRLELTMMRLFPTDIRSVVLDSTVPTQQELDTNLPANTQRVFDVLFQGCASSPTCNSKYPQLQDTFYKLVDDLNTNPVTFQDPKYGPVLLNGDSLASWLFSSLYATSFIPVLPKIIMQVSTGNYKLLSRVYTLVTLNNSVSWGMFYSVQCGEDLAFVTPQELTTASNTLRPEIKPEVLTNIQADYSVCQFWNSKPVPAEQKQPVKSSIPTLILAGEYDPVTPPANGELAAQTLTSSYYFQFPGTGHGVHYTGSCPDSIVAAFLNDPSAKPDAACIATMNEPAFR